jgi:hypothetical protein
MHVLVWYFFVVILQSEKDYDPFAERRRPTVAEKEDEYRQKRRMMIISPERVDPFAEGLFTSSQLGFLWVFYLILKEIYFLWLCCCSYFKCHLKVKFIFSLVFNERSSVPITFVLNIVGNDSETLIRTFI